MQTVIIVIHLMVVVAMIGIVLLQRSEGGGLGMGGGGGFLTNRGSANVLTRTTATLAAIFFATSLGLSLLAGFERKPRSILNTGGSPAPTAPAPLGTGGGSLLDTLRQGETAPAPQGGGPGAPAPQPSQTPQVPQSQ